MDLGTGTSFDVKTLAIMADYSTLTNSNFVIEPSNGSSGNVLTTGSGNYANGSFSLSKNYTSTNGVLTAYGIISVWTYGSGTKTNNVPVHAYLIY